MKDDFLKTLVLRYRYDLETHRLALNILMDKCVGISDHTNFIEEADKHLTGMSQARENIKTLRDEYGLPDNFLIKAMSNLSGE